MQSEGAIYAARVFGCSDATVEMSARLIDLLFEKIVGDPVAVLIDLFLYMASDCPVLFMAYETAFDPGYVSVASVVLDPFDELEELVVAHRKYRSDFYSSSQTQQILDLVLAPSS